MYNSNRSRSRATAKARPRARNGAEPQQSKVRCPRTCDIAVLLNMWPELQDCGARQQELIIFWGGLVTSTWIAHCLSASVLVP